MKSTYTTPLTEVSVLAFENILCASGGNEDFGHKNGTYDLLGPESNNFINS